MQVLCQLQGQKRKEPRNTTGQSCKLCGVNRFGVTEHAEVILSQTNRPPFSTPFLRFSVQYPVRYPTFWIRKIECGVLYPTRARTCCDSSLRVLGAVAVDGSWSWHNTPRALKPLTASSPPPSPLPPSTPPPAFYLLPSPCCLFALSVLPLPLADGTPASQRWHPAKSAQRQLLTVGKESHYPGNPRPVCNFSTSDNALLCKPGRKC